MPYICVTFDTSQFRMAALKALAWSNMKLIVVTFDVFHALRSSLKFVASLKSKCMSVTSLVSHRDMSPYVASACGWFDIHRSTAVFREAFVVKV